MVAPSDRQGCQARGPDVCRGEGPDVEPEGGGPRAAQDLQVTDLAPGRPGSGLYQWRNYHSLSRLRNCFLQLLSYNEPRRVRRLKTMVTLSRTITLYKCSECSKQILWVDQLTTEDNCGALAAWETSKHWLPCTQKGRNKKYISCLENCIFRSTLSVFHHLPLLPRHYRLYYFA